MHMVKNSMSDQQWYYESNGAQAGPISWDGLMTGIKMGKVTEETRVWATHLSEWTPLGECIRARSSAPLPPLSNIHQTKSEKQRWTPLRLIGTTIGVLVLLSIMVPVAVRQREKAYANERSSSQMSSSDLLPSGPTFTNTIGITLVKVSAGNFKMGPRGGGMSFGGDMPNMDVRIDDPYYIASTELTQGQWESVMGTRPWTGKKGVKNGPEYPAVWVSWDDAQDFCRRLSNKEKKPYRLPTEAEWEFAALAGSDGIWCFGNDATRLKEYAWAFDSLFDPREDFARPVGTKLPNAWGLFDMHGNVWEWCSDNWHEGPRGWVNDVDSAFPIARGGSYNDSPLLTETRPTYRVRIGHQSVGETLGFRVVCGTRK